MDRFTNGKSFQGFDNEIPHLEGGIPILDQPVESSSEALSPPHETPTTYDILSDVIIGMGDSILIQSQLNQHSRLDHLRKVPQSGSQRHMKVRIMMRLERQELEIQTGKMEVM